MRNICAFLLLGAAAVSAPIVLRAEPAARAVTYKDMRGDESLKKLQIQNLAKYASAQNKGVMFLRFDARNLPAKDDALLKALNVVGADLLAEGVNFLGIIDAKATEYDADGLEVYMNGAWVLKYEGLAASPDMASTKVKQEAIDQWNKKQVK